MAMLATSSAKQQKFQSASALASGRYGDSTTVNARALRQAIQRTQFCTDVASNRYALGGIHYEKAAAESTLHIVGTDGRRLANAMVQGSGGDRLDGIIPMKASKAIMNACDMDGDCCITANSSKIQVTAGNAVVTSPLVEGRYPNWRQIVPNSSSYTEVPIPASLLGSSVRQASIVSDLETRGINLDFSEGELRLSAAAAQSGRSKVVIPVAFQGEPKNLILDYKFIGDFCKAIDGGTIVDIMIGDHRAPIVLRSGSDYQYIVMPMDKS